MPYMTDYKLTVRNIETSTLFKDLVDAMKQKDLIHYAFSDGDYSEKDKEAVFLPYERVTWTDHVIDMMFLAEAFPKMYFNLEGIGESFGDVWCLYFHDMDIESCAGEIVFEAPKKVQWTELVKF